MKSVLYAEDDPDDVFFMERAFDQLGVKARLLTVQDGFLEAGNSWILVQL